MPQHLIEPVSKFVTDYLTGKLSADYVFHNLQHTHDVVAASEELATNAGLSHNDTATLLIAAWFHDIGYVDGAMGHEHRSAGTATEFLKKFGADDVTIEQVSLAIAATKMPQRPTTPIGALLCDADMSHLGKHFFWHRSSLLRHEFTKTGQSSIDDLTWIRQEIEFLENHQYKTEHGRLLYEASKELHISQLYTQLERLAPDSSERKENRALEKLQDKSLKDKKSKDKSLGRGVETMYRTVYKSHLTLSAMADNKANLMLSVNAVVLSIILSTLIPRLSNEPELTIPTMLLVGTTLVAMFYATLSTKPKVTKGMISREDIKNKKGNLLFFGNFFNMALPDYQWGMQQLIQDPDYLYDTMSRDIYFLGVVLAKKYRYLAICYTVFMVGLIVSVLAFSAAVLYTLM
jgi:predicted metal-dependent HD superfamily phosphohydrolase